MKNSEAVERAIETFYHERRFVKRFAYSGINVWRLSKTTMEELEKVAYVDVEPVALPRFAGRPHVVIESLHAQHPEWARAVYIHDEMGDMESYIWVDNYLFSHEDEDPVTATVFFGDVETRVILDSGVIVIPQGDLPRWEDLDEPEGEDEDPEDLEDLEDDEEFY